MIRKFFLIKNEFIKLHFMFPAQLKIVNLLHKYNFELIINLTKLFMFYPNLVGVKNINGFIIFNRNQLIFLVNFLRKKLIGVIRGYCLVLNLIGLGFTTTIWRGKQLRFNVGFNHLIYYNIPSNILIRSRSRRNLFLFSYSYFLLKKVGYEIKSFRRLSIYKLKGIKDKNEIYTKKLWKKGQY